MTGPKRYLAVLAAGFVIAALMAPGTSANVKNNPPDGWHEPIPNIPIPTFSKAECAVTGTVELVDNKKGHGLPVALVDPGPPPVLEGGKPVHGFFEFQDVQIICVGNPPDDLHYTGTYEVVAQGGTDGLAFNAEHELNKLLNEEDPLQAISDKPKDHPGTKDDKKSDHGEDLEQGWSHSANYCDVLDGQVDPQNVNKGDIAVRKVVGDPPQQRAVPCKTLPSSDPNKPTHPGGGTSWVKFVRGWHQDPILGNVRADGERVITWGELDWTDKKTDCFRADLIFEPTELGTKEGHPDEIVVTAAALQGTAVIYNLGDFVDAKTGGTDPDECDIQKKLTFKKTPPPPGNSGGNGGGGNGGSRGPNG